MLQLIELNENKPARPLTNRQHNATDNLKSKLINADLAASESNQIANQVVQKSFKLKKKEQCKRNLILCLRIAQQIA